ncbi:MAG TPA: GNAT family N-acetyltransferase [Chthoniobacterales bacterium]
MSHFRIRLASPNDAEVIGYHRARMFSDMGQIPERLYESFQRRSQERVRELLISGEYVGWLTTPAAEPDKIVAGAGAQLRRVLPHPSTAEAFAEGRQAVIINVFTEPEWRRQGLGELLMKEIIRWSKEQKLDRLVLHASKHGRGLYERLGFVLTNEMRLQGL